MIQELRLQRRGRPRPHNARRNSGSGAPRLRSTDLNGSRASSRLRESVGSPLTTRTRANVSSASLSGPRVNDRSSTRRINDTTAGRSAMAREEERSPDAVNEAGVPFQLRVLDELQKLKQVRALRLIRNAVHVAISVVYSHRPVHCCRLNSATGRRSSGSSTKKSSQSARRGS